MRRTIGKSNFHLLWRRRIRKFGNLDAALGFLLPFKKDPGAMIDLRAVLEASSAGHRGKRLTNDEVLKGVAKLLWSGEIFVSSDAVRHGGAAKQTIDNSTPAPPSASRALRTPKTWIEIELIDENGEPVPCEPFQIVLPDGRLVRGLLDSTGKAHFGNIDPGTCEVSFPGLDAPEWERSS